MENSETGSDWYKYPELQNTYNPTEYTNEIQAEKVTYDEYVVDEKVTTDIICDACNKKFTTKSSLKRHHERSPVCLQWLSIEKTESINYNNIIETTKNMNSKENIIDLIEKIKKKITTNDDNNSCRYCLSQFSSIGNLNKHFKTVTACNLMALHTFQEELKSLS